MRSAAALDAPMNGPSRFSRLRSRVWGPRSRDLWVTLIVRGFGGLAGVLPPLVAVLFVDAAQYGLASANYALALLLTGPVSQYVAQGYMRDVIASRGTDERARPAGSAFIYLYILIVLAALLALMGFGLSAEDAGITALLTVFAMGAKIQEVHLVAADRQKTAVTAFYILPPLLICLGIVAFRLASPMDDFWVISAAQILGYGGSLAVSCLGAHARPGDLLPPPLPRGREGWAAEFRAVRIFLGNGIILGAAEQAPTLLLKALGLAAAIPHFEIARKAGSVPSLMAHAFGMQLMPRLVGTAEQGAWQAFRAVLRTYCLMLSSLSVVYVVAVLVFLDLLGASPMLAGRIDTPVFVVLLIGALITAAAAPFGAAIIALRAESWLLVGPALSLALQLAISLGLYRSLGSTAIAWSVTAQNALLSAIVMVGTWMVLRRKEAGGS